MSGGIKRRRSKWDDKDPEAFPEDYYDRAPSRRPRECFSPGRSSRRHDSRSRENTMTLDREGNYTKVSPEQDDWRPQNSSRSPRNGWGRSHSISRSRSRSRSQSPAQNLRRESAIKVRSRNRSGASGQICRDLAAGRCKRGNSCHFLHQDAHDSRQPLERGPSDDFEGSRRRTGISRYSPDDIEDNSIRIEKSPHICNDFLKGRCRRGDACRFVHHDSSADVFEKGPVEEVCRNRDHEHRSRDHRDRSRDIYPDHDNRSRDIYPDDHRSKDVYPDRDHGSKVTYPDRDHGIKDRYPDRDHGSKDRYPDRDHGSNDRYPDRDHGSKDRYPDHDHGSRDAYPDSDHGSRDAYPDRDHGSRHKYPDHDHGSRDTYLDRDHRSRDKYSDNDHRRKDIYTDRNHESEPHRRVEIPCKFFASGNCRNGNRCRFLHQVQEVFSSEKPRNDRHDTDRNFDGSHDWDGPRWSDATVVSAVPTVPGWEEDRSEKKEVITVRIQDDEGGLDRKNGGDRVWDGPCWNDATSTPIVPQGWGDGNIEIRETAKDVTGARPSNDSWSHDMLVKPIWDPPATSVDKSQIVQQVDPLQRKTENNTPVISLSTPRVDINSGVEISPRDVKQQTIFNSSTLQTPSNSNIAFAPVQQGTAGATSSFEKHHHTDVFGEQNPSIRDNKPLSYPGERGDVLGDYNAASVIQNQAITVPQGQTFFQSDINVNVHPIPTTTPPIQSQAPDLSHAPQVEAMQEVSFQPLSSVNKVAAGPHSFGTAPAPGASHCVSNEQVAQMSHITASLTQLLESRQQFSQLNSYVPSHGMPNLPDLAAPVPPVSGASIELNEAPELLKQYDPASSITEPKNAIDEIHSDDFKLNPQENLGPSKDEENVKVTAEFRPANNGPTQDVGPDDGADEGKHLKDTKGIRPFKFALAEFVKELLKPSWKDGQVSKDAYKTIVKKVVDKVMETLGPQNSSNKREN